MKKLLPLFILIFTFSISAQIRKPVVKPTPAPIVEAKPTQKVIVEKNNGDKMTGLFVGGSAEAVTIDLDGSKITIKLSDILTLRFGDTPKPIETPTEIKTVRTTLSIEAALVYSYGGAQPISRTIFYLLDKSAEDILTEINLRGRSQNISVLDTYAMGIIYSALSDQAAIALKGTQAIKPHILKEFQTDFSGKAMIEDITPRTYWIFSVVKTRKGYAVWNLETAIKDGENKIIIDQNNAKTAL